MNIQKSGLERKYSIEHLTWFCQLRRIWLVGRSMLVEMRKYWDGSWLTDSSAGPGSCQVVDWSPGVPAAHHPPPTGPPGPSAIQPPRLPRGPFRLRARPRLGRDGQPQGISEVPSPQCQLARASLRPLCHTLGACNTLQIVLPFQAYKKKSWKELCALSLNIWCAFIKHLCYPP